MAPHFSILSWRLPVNRGVWWAAVYRAAKSQTRGKQLSRQTGRLLLWKIEFCFRENILLACHKMYVFKRYCINGSEPQEMDIDQKVKKNSSSICFLLKMLSSKNQLLPAP